MWLAAYAAIWAATLAAAVTVALCGWLKPGVRDVLGLRLQASRTPTPQLGDVPALAAHNVAIAAWPVLLGVLGAHHHRRARHVADSLLTACIAVNVLPVGAALGAYGPALLPYIPQLPLEWAGLALGASAWVIQRQRALSVARGLALVAATASLLLCAATVETLAVPHQKPAGGPEGHG